MCFQTLLLEPSQKKHWAGSLCLATDVHCNCCLEHDWMLPGHSLNNWMVDITISYCSVTQAPWGPYDILLLECVGVWQHASTSLVSISFVHKFNYCVVPEIQLFSMFPSSDCTSSLVYWKETTVIQELPNMCHYFAWAAYLFSELWLSWILGSDRISRSQAAWFKCHPFF